MKAISTGNEYRIYSDHLKVYDSLPPNSYIIRFSQLQGFFLEEYSDVEIREDKIYGVHIDKVRKCLASFQQMNRSLGVILSGAKGIGKSLFAKLLSKSAIESGYPLIVVDRFIPGIASFIEEIEQEVVVLFDEFDKTFGGVRPGDNEASPQTTLLSLFDGVSAGKKMYVVTCNELHSLNDYLVNRPGRFHYHFRFEYPDGAEVHEYLEDKLDEKYLGEIPKVVAFSRKVSLNYDCLRAIAFEIQTGSSFEEAIKDLNIVNLEASQYKLVLFFTDGSSMACRRYRMNLFAEGDDVETVWLKDGSGNEPVCVEFCPADAEYDIQKGVSIILADKLNLHYDDDVEDTKTAKTLAPAYLAISRIAEKSIHYAV